MQESTHAAAEFETIIRETWLTRKPTQRGLLIAFMTSLFLVLIYYLVEINFANSATYMSAEHDLIFEKHQLWRIWTSLFVHADSKHLLSNLFLLFIFGTFLAEYFGLFAFPLLAFSVGGLTNLIVVWGMPSGVSLIGASGVVFWMGSFWLLLYFLVDIRRSFLQRLLRSIGVGLVLFMPAEAFDPSISYKSHFIGFVLGLICAVIYYISKRPQFEAAIVREKVALD